MKKFITLAITGLTLAAIMSSCSRGYTCPTYANQDVETLEKNNNQRI